MIYDWGILFLTIIFASVIQKRCVFINDIHKKPCGWVAHYGNTGVYFGLLLITLILYSGLRTNNNDTSSYIIGFEKLDTSLDVFSEGLFTDNAGFVFFEKIIKIVFGNNATRFLTITSALTIIPTIVYFRKYSSDFVMASFIYVASTFYSFTMGAMKQTLAMAIGVWAVAAFFKKKYIIGAVLMVVAMSIHPLIAVYCAALLMKEDVWKTKTIIVVIGTIVVAITFSQVFNTVADGLGYSTEDLVDSEGTNILRVLIWLLPTVLSFIYRTQINSVCTQFNKLCINLMQIGSMCMILAGLGGANLIGRTAYYFYPFFVLGYVEVVRVISIKQNQMLKALCYLGFSALYFFLTIGPLFTDKMEHVGISALF